MSSTKTTTHKKWMAFAGLAWFVYAIYHMLSLLSFHESPAVFDNFYLQIKQTSIYYFLTILLLVLLAFHVFTAVSRQLANNASKGQTYKKAYPHGVPRIIAWSGATMLLTFIVFHFVQVKGLADENLHQQLTELLAQPIMFIIYALGVIALSAHLHHALTNVLQTLGISCKTYNALAVLIALTLLVGFLSIPVSVML